MGTTIQCKSVLPAFYSVKDINGSLCLLNNDEQTTKTGQHFDSFSLQFPDGFIEYEKEKVRQTILNHESTFRHQLHELHRLYNKQRELMSDLRMRELQRKALELEGCLPHTPPDEVKRMWHANHFPFAYRQASSSATHFPRALFGCRESANRTALFSFPGIEARPCVNPVRFDTYSRRSGCLADLNEPAVIMDDYVPTFVSNDIHGSPSVERNWGTYLNNAKFVHGGYRQERFSLDINADAPSSEDLPGNTNAETQKKKKIFGVVISEGKGEQIFSAASGGDVNISSQKQRVELNGVESGMNGDIREEKSYHMNIGLLQNCSHQFFKKPEAAADEAEAANVANQKIFGVPIFKFSVDSGKVNAEEAASANHFKDSDSGFRNQIDLNICLHGEEEEEEEATMVPELEENVEEVQRLAAEAIVSISSSSGDCLKWFADLICSQLHESSTLKGEKAEDDEEDPIPDGMDYFEFTTLKLKDEKCYEPSILDVCFDEDRGGEGEKQEVSRPKRRARRRAPAARRDFQRNVLPGLVSLSRHEVSEDILTFQELLKKSGDGDSLWRSRKKGGGRRRRRCGPLTNHRRACSEGETRPERMMMTVMSLTAGGLGKRTRRRPRQKFPMDFTQQIIRHI